MTEFTSCLNSFFSDNLGMTRNDRNHIITWVWLAAFILFTPRLCAQTMEEQSSEAAQTRTTFVEYGKKYIGRPYVSGATGPNSFDCSGFVYAVSRESIGYQLPRTVKAIYGFCKIIDDSERQPGDLVFFKTTSSETVSHVGIYIGNGQFLNCASDGPNTGVILSSLKENYWKSRYYKTGRFLTASSQLKENDSSSQSTSTQKTSAGTATGSTSSATASAGTNSFWNKIILDGTFYVDWNFLTPENFRLTFRGLTTEIHAMYEGKKLHPGFGSIVRWDSGTGIVQLPLIFTLTMSDYVRIFAGPVISIGTPYLPGDKDEKIEASVFPGILGICFNTPSFKAGKADISFAQDIHYTVFNKTDGSALSVLNSIASGLVFSSGVRVTLPLASLLK